MKKYNKIYPDVTVNEYTWLKSILYLRDAIVNENHFYHTVFTDIQVAKQYYKNALYLAKEHTLFGTEYKEVLESVSDLDSLHNTDKVVVCIDKLINNRLVLENNTVVSVGSVNGMGEILLPNADELGSGDLLGTVGTIKNVKKPKKKNKINNENQLDEKQLEFYVPISLFKDPSNLIKLLSTKLSRKYNVSEVFIQNYLTDLEISYNGTVSLLSISKLSGELKIEPKELKKTIDSLIDVNIDLLESVQLQILTSVLLEHDQLSESLLGRALGGIGGFLLGPTVGKLIARVLGVEKGPLYNLLTSRIVNAALAQELSKNII